MIKVQREIDGKNNLSSHCIDSIFKKFDKEEMSDKDDKEEMSDLVKV